MDGFWIQRCLKNYLDLPDLNESSANSANAFCVAKNRTNMDKIIPFGLILVFKVVEGPINLPAIIGQFVNGGKLSQSFKELHF